jgi:hypothetical protein
LRWTSCDEETPVRMNAAISIVLSGIHDSQSYPPRWRSKSSGWCE